MYVRRQKNLVLILARELASKLATPMFVADAEGKLVFYNEPAEDIIGRSFAEAGEMDAEQWSELFDMRSLEGEPITLQENPAGIALMERRPAHGSLRIRGLDGVERALSVTGLPLFAHTAEVVGVVAIFWEEP